MKEQIETIIIPLKVLSDIERKFRATTERLHPKIWDPSYFPLPEGADAFLAYFKESTKKFLAGTFLME